MNISQQQEKKESVQAVSSLPTIPGKRKISTRNVSSVNFSAPLNQLVLNQSLKSASSVEDDTFCVIAAPPASAMDITTEQLSNNSGDPTHIPVVEESTTVSNGNSSSNSNNIDNTYAKGDDEKGEMEMENNNNNNNSNNKSVHLGEDVMSDESEYEYEDDDDAAFSGFLIANNDYGTTSNNNNNNNNNVATSSTAPARIVEEDTGTVAASSRSLAINSKSASSSATSSLVDGGESEGVAVSAASAVAEPTRKKWREPSRAAVNMSLRAQQETSGSKRRLAQDLFRIMNQDHKEAGFSLAPQTEDSMERWTIKLFQFDPDSNLAKDMMVLGIDHVEIEMRFPEQYPFEPPFVRVVKPRFKRQTGFVMNGALCMELLTKDGWNPINDIESVIVSVRSLLVVGDGRIQAATDMTKAKYETLLSTAQQEKLRATSSTTDADGEGGCNEHEPEPEQKKARTGKDDQQTTVTKSQVGSYTATEAQAAYSHLSDYHKKKGWDTSGWWARKG